MLIKIFFAILYSLIHFSGFYAIHIRKSRKLIAIIAVLLLILWVLSKVSSLEELDLAWSVLAQFLVFAVLYLIIFLMRRITGLDKEGSIPWLLSWLFIAIGYGIAAFASVACVLMLFDYV